jgi:hypothetical protein
MLIFLHHDVPRARVLLRDFLSYSTTNHVGTAAVACPERSRRGCPVERSEISLPLSPFQLRPQHIKKRSFKMQQLHLVIRLPAANHIPILHRHANLAVNA